MIFFKSHFRLQDLVAVCLGSFNLKVVSECMYKLGSVDFQQIKLK